MRNLLIKFSCLMLCFLLIVLVISVPYVNACSASAGCGGATAWCETWGDCGGDELCMGSDGVGVRCRCDGVTVTIDCPLPV